MVTSQLQVVQPQQAATPKTSYGLFPAFEEEVVYLCCSFPRFWGRIGNAIEPESMGTPVTKLLMQAAHAVAADSGNGPANSSVVMQRIKRWSEEGRVTKKQIDEALAMFDAVEDRGVPTGEAVIAELKPVLQRRMQKDAVQAAVQGYTAKDDLTAVAKMIDKASRLGDTNLSAGISLDNGVWDVLSSMSLTNRLSTGIEELDALIDGGIGRGQLGIAVGGPGDGKSMFLNHVATDALLSGLTVAYLTLEIPEPLVISRLMANLLDVPEKAMRGGKSNPEAQERMKNLKEFLASNNRKLGDVKIHYMTPHATTVQDVKEWIALVEEELGKPVDLLVVDYADKLYAKKEKEYEAMRVVYEGLRHFAVEKNFWVWTASQATRQKDSKSSTSTKGINDLADSQHKARAADLVLTLNATENGSMMTIYVAKNRTSDSQLTAGPMPTDFKYGRIGPIKR